ncbi:MAG TPA: flavin reductase family protein [Aquabacterium sp.]|nr:flavin reductase family protein [Aquabacterium sp.]
MTLSSSWPGRPVDLVKAYRLLNHGPTVLVSAAHAGQRNVMAAAWNMPLDFDPPKVAVVIDKQAFTRGLVEASGEFVLQVPPVAMLQTVMTVGTQTGREVDKFAQCGLTVHHVPEVSAPLVEGCLAWLACKVLPEALMAQRYDLFLAEVVGAWADPAVFRDGRWHFADEGQGPDDRRSIHHVAGGAFFVTGRAVQG